MEVSFVVPLAHPAPEAEEGKPEVLNKQKRTCTVGSPAVEPRIVKEGWLYKRGQHIRNWRKRYFLLFEDGSLLGFKDQPKNGQFCGPLNDFTVRGCQVMCKEKRGQFIFIICGLRRPRKIQRMFSVGTSKERTKWVDAIDSVDRSLQEELAVVADSSEFEQGRLRDPSQTGHIPKLSLDDFELLQVLGRGSFGKVVLCRERPSHQLFAIKFLKKEMLKSMEDVAQTQTECRVLRSTNHPFLIALKCSFQTADRLCFVMEYASGGELLTHLLRAGVFSEDTARFYGAEIMLALEYLHGEGVVYRDLKLQNVMLDNDGHIKITDFGLCKDGMTFGATTRTLCGTPRYMAPEMLSNVGYGRAVDWWCLGVAMYQMMCGRTPFHGTSRNTLFKAIRSDEVYLPSTLSLEARRLLRGLLSKNPKKRLGGAKGDAKDIKAHAFFRGISWNQMLSKELAPPFKPRLAWDTDTCHFDTKHTGETALLTPMNHRRGFSN